MKAPANAPAGLETRRRDLASAELRSAVVDGKRVAVGYAAVFNSLSEDLGGFREICLPGCFKDSIAEADVRALVDHIPSLILGRSKSGTLRMVEDSKGLLVEIDFPDTSAARDLAASMDRGDVDGMSFGFRVASDDWKMTDGIATRSLIKVHVFDVSIVTYPAYPATDVALRSLATFKALPPARLGPSPLARAFRELALLDASF